MNDTFMGKEMNSTNVNPGNKPAGYGDKPAGFPGLTKSTRCSALILGGGDCPPFSAAARPAPVTNRRRINGLSVVE
jgi:hypothetical protein